jgi:uncharacterized cupredoxin-like copper-binding protein
MWRPPLALAVLAAAACSSSSLPAAANVRLDERDFRLTVPGTALHAGPTVLHVRNAGPDTHEMLLFRTDLAADRLPLRPDGVTVNEDSSLLQLAGSAQGLPAGASATVMVNLRPGHYVWICNMAGHYAGGMRQDLQALS